LAHNRAAGPQTRRNRDPWEERLLAAENHPLRQIALKNDMAMIRHYDTQITALEEQLHKSTKDVAARDYALLQTVPGIGEHLGMTILHEIGDIDRFPTVKDFLSYCRLVKGIPQARDQRRQDQGPARSQARQSLPPLGLR
jgi:transposase